MPHQDPCPARFCETGLNKLRLLPLEIADGPRNMAADDTLLHSAAARRIASLRFYGWQSATASLGYFQKAAERLADPAVAGLPWVRRSTGGATLVHDQEVTYALALPPGKPWQTNESWMRRMHQIIAQGLAKLGVTRPITLVEQQQSHGALLCFQQHTPGDLVCGGAKIVGSAQRKLRQNLLQHGGILLAQSPYTPQLPGVLELTGVLLTRPQAADAIAVEFANETGWLIERGAWTDEERRAISQTATQKYGAAAWNERR